MAYTKKQGGTVSRVMYDQAQEILMWVEQFVICLATRQILGKKNILTHHLAHLELVLPINWSLLPWLFDTICKRVWASPHQSLCHKKKYETDLVCVSCDRSYGLEGRHFPVQLGWSHHLCLTPFVLLKQILSNVDLSELLHDL